MTTHATDQFVKDCREGNIVKVIEGLKKPIVLMHKWCLVKGTVAACSENNLVIALEVLKHLSEHKGLMHECFVELVYKSSPTTLSKLLEKAHLQDPRSLWRTLLLSSAKANKKDVCQMLLSHSLCKPDFIPGKKALLASTDKEVHGLLIAQYIKIDKMDHLINEIQHAQVQQIPRWVDVMHHHPEVFRPYYDAIFDPASRFLVRLDVTASKSRLKEEALSFIQKEHMEWMLKDNNPPSVKRKM